MDRALSNVEVLIPTFQRAQLLLRAIKSVQNQTYPALKICVYDNASTDETQAVVSQLAHEDPRIRYYRNAKNLGTIGNFNLALSKVKEPYFSFLSDDDELLPDCISDAVRMLNDHTDTVYWGGNIVKVDSATGRINRGSGWLYCSQNVIYSPVEACARICSGDHMEFPGLVFRTRMVKDAKISFNDSVGLADVDFELALASQYSVGMSSNLSAKMSVHAGSASSGVRPLELYWPAMKVIGERISYSEVLSEIEKRRCAREWKKTVIFLLVNYAPLWVENHKVTDYTTLSGILQEYCPDSFLSFACQKILGLYSCSRPTAFLGWILLKLLHFAARPKAYNNIFLPMAKVTPECAGV